MHFAVEGICRGAAHGVVRTLGAFGSRLMVLVHARPSVEGSLCRVTNVIPGVVDGLVGDVDVDVVLPSKQFQKETPAEALRGAVTRCRQQS